MKIQGRELLLEHADGADGGDAQSRLRDPAGGSPADEMNDAVFAPQTKQQKISRPTLHLPLPAVACVTVLSHPFAL